MLGLRGSFLGFTFNSLHSSILGITRTYSKRLDKKLIPDIKDIFVEIPNGDGQYWFGQTYTKREFKVSFAFEEITEEQLRRMQQVWNDKQIHELIFDEEPYKVYSAKLTGAITVKHLAFEIPKDGGMERVYRGEGSLTFTCYSPFARSRYPYLEDYTVLSVAEWIADEDEELNSVLQGGGRTNYSLITSSISQDNTQGGTIEDDLNKANYDIYRNSDYVNINEWLSASRIPSNKIYSQWDAVGGQYRLFNAGDIDTPFKVYFALPQNTTDKLSIEINTDKGSRIVVKDIITKHKNFQFDRYIEFDMKECVLCGCDAHYERTGFLYNEYLEDGSFFYLPPGENILTMTESPAKSDIYYLYI